MAAEVAEIEKGVANLEISDENKNDNKIEKKDYSNEYDYVALDKETLLLVKQLHKELFPGVDYGDLLDADLLSGESRALLLFEKSDIDKKTTLAGILTYKIEERKIRDTSKIDSWKYRYVAYIQTVGVSNKHRRRGLAKKMLKECINRCLNEEQIYVSKNGKNEEKSENTLDSIELHCVYCTNDNPTPAFKLYKSFGFYERIKYTKYYEYNDDIELDFEDAWLMIYAISQRAITEKDKTLKNRNKVKKKKKPKVAAVINGNGAAGGGAAPKLGNLNAILGAKIKAQNGNDKDKEDEKTNDEKASGQSESPRKKKTFSLK